MKARRFVLLDRDGTIIFERHYLSDPTEVELLPGAASGLRKMRELGLGLALITNQSAVGRGLIEKAQLDSIHERMCELLKMENVILDGIYYCPHMPEDMCSCRKPGTALIDFASEELKFDPCDCYVVGDKDCDIAMGKRVGATTLLVLTGHGEVTRAEKISRPDFVVGDLDEAATIIGCLLRRAYEGNT